jgi:hypothetical protein
VETKEELLAAIEGLHKQLQDLRTRIDAHIEYGLHYQKLRLAVEYSKVRDAGDCILPKQIVGFVGKDTEEIDRDEHGIIQQEYVYLGCPQLKNGSPFRQKGINVLYDDASDVVKILTAHKGQYLRVTIEALSIEEREDCKVCDLRFQCLTSV